jgi:hypothetical protein
MQAPPRPCPLRQSVQDKRPLPKIRAWFTLGRCTPPSSLMPEAPGWSSTASPRVSGPTPVLLRARAVSCCRSQSRLVWPCGSLLSCFGGQPDLSRSAGRTLTGNACRHSSRSQADRVRVQFWPCANRTWPASSCRGLCVGVHLFIAQGLSAAGESRQRPDRLPRRDLPRRCRTTARCGRAATRRTADAR